MKEQIQQSPLALNDFEIFVLEDTLTNTVKGKGISRSNRRTGDCSYSRRNGMTFEDCNGNDQCDAGETMTGCYPG